MDNSVHSFSQIQGSWASPYNDSDYTQDTARTAHHPWLSFQDMRVIRGPAAFARRSTQPVQVLITTNPESVTPRSLPFSTQQVNSSSRLSTEEQAKRTTNKLRKQIYNPITNKLSERLCLYYKDRAKFTNHARNMEEEDDPKRCAICLEDFEANEQVMVTPCNHMYHEECLLPWLQKQNKCPVCRHVIDERPKTSMHRGRQTANPPSTTSDVLAGDLLSTTRAMEDFFIRALQ